jgi:hypothetical protein
MEPLNNTLSPKVRASRAVVLVWVATYTKYISRMSSKECHCQAELFFCLDRHTNQVFFSFRRVSSIQHQQQKSTNTKSHHSSPRPSHSTARPLLFRFSDPPTAILLFVELL